MTFGPLIVYGRQRTLKKLSSLRKESLFPRSLLSISLLDPCNAGRRVDAWLNEEWDGLQMMLSFELEEKIFKMQDLVALLPNGIMVHRLQAGSTTIVSPLCAMFQGVLIIGVHGSFQSPVHETCGKVHNHKNVYGL